MHYYLGADVGSSKTQVLVADEAGHVLGLGASGAGNYQVVGYEGMQTALQEGIKRALHGTGIQVAQIAGAGFGISGYDWPSDEPRMIEVIRKVGLLSPLELHNDAILGLAAGAEEGWGLAVVSGAGCNCWGWNKARDKIGRVTGFGVLCGEAAGGSELVFRAMQLVAQAWTGRGDETALSQAFIDYSKADNIEELLEGYTTGRYEIGSSAAPVIFQVAQKGDLVAQQLVQWAGRELGELAKAVIHQLNFQAIDFDVILVGSMFEAGEQLVAPMRESICELAPGARLVRLGVPPVVGAVLLGMQAGGLPVTQDVRQELFGKFQ